MTRARAEQRGRRGEWVAEWWLRLHGWRVLARRVKTARGEIDLIMRRRQTVAFVEVKWRQRGSDRDAAIDSFRLRRVAAAAESVAARFISAGDDLRIDVLLLAPGHWPRHIVNAWQP